MSSYMQSLNTNCTKHRQTSCTIYKLQTIACIKGQYHHDQQGMESERWFRLTHWLKIILHMIRSYYHCCCINEPVIFSHCVHIKLGHQFHALLKVCYDCDDIVPFKGLVSQKENYKTSNFNVNLMMVLILHIRFVWGTVIFKKSEITFEMNLGNSTLLTIWTLILFLAWFKERKDTCISSSVYIKVHHWCLCWKNHTI